MASNLEYCPVLWLSPGFVLAGQSVPFFDALASYRSLNDLIRILYPTNASRLVEFQHSTSIIYILDPEVPPGPHISNHQVDLATTSVIATNHPAVRAAHEALRARMRATDPNCRARMKELIFARNRFFDTEVPKWHVRVMRPDEERPAQHIADINGPIGEEDALGR